MIDIEEIRKNSDKINWYDISKLENLSVEFILEFSYKINFYGLSFNDYISDDVKEFCKIFT